MADKKWTAFDVETAATGARVAIIYPDGGSPSGYKNATITETNFKSSLQSQITTNAGNISTNTSDISDLQDIISKRLDTGKTTAYSFTQATDAIITDVYFSGTGTVSVSSVSPADDNIVESKAITGSFRHVQVSSTVGYNATGAPRTIYVNVSGGNVDIAIFSKLNLFT